MILLAVLLSCQGGGLGDGDGDGWTVGKGDCDDGDATRFPGAEEACDGIDQDCNGQVDDAQMTDLYVDDDGDGYGAGDPVIACAGTEGLAGESGDCDDADATVNPGVREVCNDRDDDCDLGVDEDATDARVYYLDGDGDGYGATEVTDCSLRLGYAEVGGDCLEEGTKDGLIPAEEINPGAPELCNGVDDDCDGVIDGGVDPDTCAAAGPSAWTTTRPGTRMGSALTAVDLDRDGSSEVVIGAPAEDCGAECGGAVYVCEASGGGPVDVDDCRVGLAPTSRDGQLGTALATGDLDGDGRGELVVVGPAADCGASNRGAAYVWYGSDLAGLGGATDLADAAAICGDVTRSQWDQVFVAPVGGSGHDDLVLADDYGSGIAVFVFPGEAAGDLPANASSVGDRARVSLESGGVVAAGADLDGDGYGEIVLGGVASGRVSVCSGADLAGSGALSGEYAAPATCGLVMGTSTFGTSLVVVPDLNGDGLGDLVVGEPGYDGDRSDVGRYLFYGSAGLVDGGAGTAWGELRGDADSGQIGAYPPAVTGTGSGVRVAVGTPSATGWYSQEGVVYVASGVPGAASVLSEVAVARVAGSEISGQYGTSVLLADVTGDGAPDLTAGAPSGAVGWVYVTDGAGW